jgi:outer membrane protein OmpA-like peptidoglycan-associated protein
MRAIILGIAATIAAPAAADVERPDKIEGLGEVFFEFDSARLEAQSAALDHMAERAKACPTMKIVLDGHADPRGTEPYNVALAARRTDSVRSKLVARGVDPDRIVIVTYGEDGLQRSTYAMDRRVTVWGTTLPLYTIVDESLERGTAVMWDEPVTETALRPPRSTQVAIP